MSSEPRRPETRADLRQRDDHHSWREVYHALDCQVSVEPTESFNRTGGDDESQ